MVSSTFTDMLPLLSKSRTFSLSLSHQQSLSILPLYPWQTLTEILSPWVCLFWTLHMYWIADYVTFYIWLLLSSILSRFIHVIPCVHTSSFLWLSDIPLCGHATFCLCSHPLMDIWVVSSLGLLWAFVYKFLCGYLLAFLLGIDLRILVIYKLADQ